MKRTTLTAMLAIGLMACSSSGESGTSSTTSETTSSTSMSTTMTGSGGNGTTSSTQTSTASGGAGGASTGDAGTGGSEAFTLTSTAFMEGAAIPPKYACSGANVSPDLDWTAGPAGTKSYAVVLTDKSNNLLHWVIWDIPASVTALPEDVEKVGNPSVPMGAKQVKSYDNATVGYLGPCPPNQHTYEFAVHALDVETLPNVTTASTRAMVNAEIKAHDLGSVTLTGTFTP